MFTRPNPLRVRREEIAEGKRRLAQELPRALIFQNEQRPLDRPDRGRGNVAVGAAHVLRIVIEPDEDRLQVLQVEKGEPLFIGDAEGNVEHSLLHVRQLHHSRKQQRSELAHRRADRMARLAEEVPEDDRKAAIGIVGHADLCRASGEGIVGLGRGIARQGEARDVALHILHHDRDAGGRERLGQPLDRHGLAGARRTGDKPVAVGVAQQELARLAIVLAATADEDRTIRHASTLVFACW